MKSDVRPHLPEEELHAWLDGALSTAQAREVAQHLLACLICRALEGEVRVTRTRSAELLAMAVPRVHTPTGAARSRRRHLPLRLGGAAAAALALVAALGNQLVDRNVPDATEGNRIATAFVAPAILAKLTMPRPDSAARLRENTNRTLTLASRATVTPRVIPGRQPAAPASSRRLETVDPMLQAGISPGWETTSLAEAREAAAGALSHLKGLPVSAVRIQESELGGRPTALVRQLLNDGRAVWVVEGAVEELGGITRLLSASGLTMSTPRRARPDYIGPENNPRRTVRMVTIASYLPVDSLDALATRLTL